MHWIGWVMKFEKLMKDLENCESEEQIKEVVDNAFDPQGKDRFNILMHTLLGMLRKRDDIVFKVGRKVAYAEDDQELIKDIITKFISTESGYPLSTRSLGLDKDDDQELTEPFFK